MTKGHRNRNNGTETKSDNFPFCVFKSDNISFLLKCTKVFEPFSESKLISFMSMVNPNNGSETKSDAFLWDIFKSDTICFLSKNTKIFQWLSKSNISVFLLHWTQTIEMRQNQVFFHGIYSNLTSFLIGHKIMKYLNDWHQRHISISSQKWM